MYINHNGTIVFTDDASAFGDRQFRFGNGLFETMLVRDGVLELEAYHSARLQHSLALCAIQLADAGQPGWLTAQVLAAARANGLEQLCRTRMQVYTQAGQAAYVVECFPVPADVATLNDTGLIVGIATGVSKQPGQLSRVKSVERDVYLAATQQASASGWYDALICNTGGNIAESTRANVFWVKDGLLYTPPLNDGCVAGVMRRYIMDNVPVSEQSLTPQALEKADEVLLTNALRRVKWIGVIGSRQYDDTVARSLHQRLSGQLPRK
jgi:branched-chain amino acid aminotransferase